MEAEKIKRREQQNKRKYSKEESIKRLELRKKDKTRESSDEGPSR